MATVNVKLGSIGSHWTAACKQAVADLNSLFRRKGVPVVLAIVVVIGLQLLPSKGVEGFQARIERI